MLTITYYKDGQWSTSHETNLKKYKKLVNSGESEYVIKHEGLFAMFTREVLRGEREPFKLNYVTKKKTYLTMFTKNGYEDRDILNADRLAYCYEEL